MIESAIVYQLGLGGLGGFLVGYALKKVAKVIAVVSGLLLIPLLYLAHIGIINVNYDKLREVVSKFIGTIGFTGELTSLVTSYLPFTGSFAVGFLFGLKKG